MPERLTLEFGTTPDSGMLKRWAPLIENREACPFTHVETAVRSAFSGCLPVSVRMSEYCSAQNSGFPLRIDPVTAHRIFADTAACRIMSDGSIETADSVTVSRAEEFDDAAAERFMNALTDALSALPDAPGPLVWIYPDRAAYADRFAEIEAGDKFIGDCINSGLPLSCVISSEYIEQIILMKGCVFICPEFLSEQVRRLAGMNGIISYSGSDSTPQDMLDALARTGYRIGLENMQSNTVLSLIHHDNGFMLSAAGKADAAFCFSAGFPVLTGHECLCTGNGTSYRVNGSLHGECRVFVNQTAGRITAQVYPDKSPGCRKAICVSGLDRAFVRFYPERAGARECRAYITDGTPAEGWRFSEDESGKTFMYALNVSGEIIFKMV